MLAPGFHELLKSQPHCARVQVDRKGVVRSWNAGAQKIFGFSGSEVVGKKIELIIPNELRAKHWRGFFQFVRTGTSALPESVVSEGLTKNGERVAVVITVRTLRDPSGRISGIEAAVIPA